MACTALGAGAASHLYVGTSGWIACTTEEEAAAAAPEEGVFRILHATAGQQLRAASMVTAGGAAQWCSGLLWGEYGDGQVANREISVWHFVTEKGP